MKRLVITLVLSAFAFSALAQATAVAVQDEAKQTEVTKVTGDNARPNDRNCLRETGTRIVRRDKQECVNANGKSYDREDIDRTGAVDVADALQRLDTGITGRR